MDTLNGDAGPKLEGDSARVSLFFQCGNVPVTPAQGTSESRCNPAVLFLGLLLPLPSRQSSLLHCIIKACQAAV